MNWSRASLTACLTHIVHSGEVESAKQGWGWGAGLFLLLDFLPALRDPVSNTIQLSHAAQLGSGLEEQTGAYERVDPRATFLMGDNGAL